MRCSLSVFLFIISGFLSAQNGELGIGQWREHLPYNRANSVSAGNGKVYCGSEAAFIEYDIYSEEIKRHSTISGLSDIGIELLKFNSYTNSLLVAYKNGNLDIVKGNTIINIPAVKDASIIGDKGIYNIRFEKELAYLSCGFGIVVVNMSRKEIKDTYLIGNNSKPIHVNDVFLANGSNQIIAATNAGIIKANQDDNLSDFNSWSLDTNLPVGAYSLVDSFAGHFLYVLSTTVYDSNIVYGQEGNSVRIMDEFETYEINTLDVFDNRLFVSRLYNVLFMDESFKVDGGYYEYETNKGMQPAQTILYNNLYWVADETFGLALVYPWGGYKFITPNGPNTLNTNNIDIKNGVLWSSSGLLDPDFQFSFNPPQFNRYAGLTWTGIDERDQPILVGQQGFVKIAINPFNTSEVYSGSWDKGLLEMHDGVVTRIYNDTNKLLFNHTLSVVQGTNQIRVGGLVFDEDQNLWITNSQVSKALSVKTPEGTWYNSFNLGGAVGDFTIVGEVIIDRNGYKWILLNRKKEIIVLDDKGTFDNPLDDDYAVLNGQEGSGNIPGDRINCIAEDLNGAIWIGTNEGPAVFYSSSSIFENKPDAQRIYVQQDGQTQILLETENIKTIAVDGANRKWFGSTNSGVYLMSEDGATEVNHFTKINSPLFSDDIKDIEINPLNGEVFFCTDYGLISYKGTATQGDDHFSQVQVYPNPVPESYTGLIAIKGLAQNSNVKITDINGLLVYETEAKGGQAIWNGYSTSGKKAKNGVYLVFSTDPKGEEHNVTKFLYLGN